MQVKKQQLEPCMEQLIGSRLRKEYDRVVYCHPVSLYTEFSSVQSLSHIKLFVSPWTAAHRLNEQGDNRQPCHIPFSILSQSVVPNRALNIASWPAYRFLRRQVRQSGIPTSLRAFHSLLWSAKSKAFSQWCSQWNRGRFFFWNSLALSMIQQMLVIWSLVPLPFLNPSWTSASSSFT